MQFRTVFYTPILKNINYRNQGYNEGYTDGLAASQDNATITYTYHAHGDGYCTKIPKYHAHSAYGGSCYTPIYCGANLRYSSSKDNYYCDNYTDGSADYHWFGSSDPSNGTGKCPEVLGYSLSCGKTTSTVDSYYCNLTTSTIVSATITFK